MNVRYPVTLLLSVIATLCAFGYVVIWVRAMDPDGGLGSEENYRRAEAFKQVLGWLWFSSGFILGLLFFHRWFIQPGGDRLT